MKKILQSAFVLLALSSFFSRALGLVRDRLLASYFGATVGEGIYDLDIYYAAFRIPDMIFNLLVMGTISAAFVPVFVDYLSKEEKEKAWIFANNALNFILLVLLFLAGISFFFAPWLMKFLVPGFDKEKLDLTVKITRIMLLSPIFFSLSSVGQAIQNGFKVFYAYSLAPIIYNLSIIVSIFFSLNHGGVYSLAYGVVFGSVLHFLVQIPAMKYLGFKYKICFDYKREDVRKFLKLMIPRIFGASAMQFSLLIDTIIASTLIGGSLSIMNYSLNIQSLPMGIIGVSFAIASFSTLAGLASKKRTSDFVDYLLRHIEKVVYLVLPASVGLILVRDEIVTLILRGGKFTSLDASLASKMIMFYSFGLIAQSVIPMLSRAFYSWHNTKTPVLISLFSFSLNAALSLLFIKVLNFDVSGLAISNAIASFFNVMLLFYTLKKFLKIKKYQFNFQLILNSVSSVAIMAGVILFLKFIIYSYFDSSINYIGNFLILLLLSACGAIIYFFFSRKYFLELRKEVRVGEI